MAGARGWDAWPPVPADGDDVVGADDAAGVAVAPVDGAPVDEEAPLDGEVPVGVLAW